MTWPMYCTNRQRISESRVLVTRAIYARTINYSQIIAAYHQLANALECTGHKDEAIIVDQIICGYQHLEQAQAPPPHIKRES